MLTTIIGLVLLAIWVLVPTGIIFFKVCLKDHDDANTDEEVRAYHE